jgi:phosphotransferase system  glucose/maltose/N-acetylglucosamine-specific IIC component
VWSLIAPIVALFIGGLVAGRMAPTINTANAAIHGAVVWALSVIAACFTLFTLMRMMPGMLQPPPDLGPSTTTGADRGTQILQVADWTGKAMLVQVIVALLALGAAVLGAFVSVRHERREHVLMPQHPEPQPSY